MRIEELFYLLPLITLSGVILTLLMIIAFWRNLKACYAYSVIGLIVTLYSIVASQPSDPVMVTPLILMDSYTSFFSAVIILTSLGVTLISYNYLENRGPLQEEFFLLLLLSTLGALVVISSNHFASFILGLELLSVSIYALISYPAWGLYTLEAALKYLILSGVASAFLLLGIAFIYAATGTLSFPLLSANLSQSTGSPDLIPLDLMPLDLMVMAGTGLFLAGLSFKLSLAPFHMWTPDVYEGAPAPVTAFIATVSKGAIFILLLRFFVITEAYENQPLVIILSVLAIASMLAGNILALLQNSIKRMLAYSSIAHLGYLMVAFIAGGMAGGRALAIEASSYFLIAYIVTTLGAFSVIAMLSLEDETHDRDQLEYYQGLFWRHPFLATALSAMMLSLAGIPLTIGFIGKFYIFASGVQNSLWLLLGVLIVGSGISLFYYLRVIFTMTLRTKLSETQIRIPIPGGWVLAILTLTLVSLGVYPTPLINAVKQMISSLN